MQLLVIQFTFKMFHVGFMQVLICTVRVLKLKETIFLYNTNGLVCLIEIYCVLSKLGILSLYVCK
jgi:hypothetical protein